ncbi:MAG: DUF697 domain-containing protein [bacterium]|nr:DUF697 domain-containing protein [bacterium]
MATWFGAALALVGLALLGWVLSSLGEVHARLAEISAPLANVVLIGLIVVLFSILLLGLRFLWAAARAGRPTATAADVAADPHAAAGQSVVAARQQIELVSDEIAKRALTDEIETVSHDLAAQRYTVVVFGTGSAGKTSVINALLGGGVGETDPTIGTTQEGVEHAYVLDGFDDGRLRLVDTPGLGEMGDGGLMREQRARELATEADLLLFVVDQDLRDVEFKPLKSLAQLGKRSLLVFNKRDLYTSEDEAAVRRRLGERVAGLIGEEDVVVCAAAPAEIIVRDASGTETLDKPTADTGELAERIADLLRREGKVLLAGNVLLRAQRVSERARDAIHQARVQQAQRVVTRFQWTTAAVMFVNPVPGLGALAAAAINYQMVLEIAKLFGTPITIDAAKRMASELGQVMLKMGVVSVATNILGKALKASVVGYVAGGAIEAVAGAYLTKLAGEAFTDYFAHDQDWGEGGMQGALEKRFQLEGRVEFIAAFVKEAAERVLAKGRGDAGQT